jgi:hypothetical protein
LLAGHSAVRCAQCGHQWRPDLHHAPAAPPPGSTLRSAFDSETLPPSLEESPMEIAAAEDAPILIAPERTPRTVPPPPRPAGFLVWLGWVCTLAVLVLVLWGAYARRDAVMQAWPPSTRLYAALGLAPAAPEAATPPTAAPATPANATPTPGTAPAPASGAPAAPAPTAKTP